MKELIIFAYAHSPWAIIIATLHHNFAPGLVLTLHYLM